VWLDALRLPVSRPYPAVVDGGTLTDMKSDLPPWALANPSRSDAGAEPVFETVEALRVHRKRQAALAYRLFGLLNWGLLGDGHITTRDPERPDHFWLLKYGVAFNQATVADLVLVAPDGSVVEGEGPINMTAYYIHSPIHEARPDVICVAHTHTHYGTPWAANVEEFQMISQEATAFFEDQSIFYGEEVQVASVETGKAIAAALGGTKGVMLRNHGPLTVGRSVEECIGWFLEMERVAEAHIKATRPKPISDEAARVASVEIGHAASAVGAWHYAIASKIPDASVVD
jgi:ribulose-5-phosphate 4-epimerase/fuculose-1-phosphate aldolase